MRAKSRAWAVTAFLFGVAVSGSTIHAGDQQDSARATAMANRSRIMAYGAELRADKLKAASKAAIAAFETLHDLAKIDKSYADLEQAALEICTRLNGPGPAENVRAHDAADVARALQQAATIRPE